MTPAEFQTAVAAATNDRDLRKVLRAADTAMRRGVLDPIGLAEALVALATHPNAGVRQDVAEASDTFPDAFFDRAFETLSNDCNHYVVTAASGASVRRATARKARAKEEHDGEKLKGALAKIEEKHGKGARRMAERAAREGTAQETSRLFHEVTKIQVVIEAALSALRCELAGPQPAKGALLQHEATLSEHFGYLRSMVKRAREYTTEIRPCFTEEKVLDLVSRAKEQLIERLGERGRGVCVSVDEVPRDLVATLDAGALLQALQNILENAVEAYPATAKERAIRVSARTLRKGTVLELTVQDFGAGMNEEQQAMLFVPFSSRKPGGTGVGMPMVKKMVEEVHGGTLAVESARGVGTTVTMVLAARRGAM